MREVPERCMACDKSGMSLVFWTLQLGKKRSLRDTSGWKRSALLMKGVLHFEGLCVRLQV